MGHLKATVRFRFRLFRNLFIPQEHLTRNSIDVFAASGNNITSIDKTHEMATLRWLTTRPELLEMLLAEMGLKGRVGVDVGISDPFLPRYGHGDIDLLAVPANDPRYAVAVQAKRFKVAISDSGDTVSLDGKKLDSLIGQCNQTALCGFDRIYGLVLVMVDGQHHAAASLLHRRTSERTFRGLYHFIKREPLNPRIGMVFLEITQPTFESFQDFGVFAVGLDERATSFGQNGEFSQRVAWWTEEMRRKGRVYDVQPQALEGNSIPVSPEDEIGLRFIRRQQSAL